MQNIQSILPGQMVGRYQLAHLIGRGGMGEVWLALDTQLRRQVAIKLLPPALASNHAYLADFTYEARAVAALDHVHILGVHDFGEHALADGSVLPYLVMPYVPGGTLADRIRAANGPLPVAESLHYLRQAALAIDYAHSKGVLHRDVKPANMLLQGDWLLLADFGIAKVLNGLTARGQTHAGMGTPAYMAPEQITAQALPASDRYSLAAIAYQLFAGRGMFQGTSQELITFQVQAAPPSPRQFNPQIPPAVEAILLQALSKKPEARPPSCRAFVDALYRTCEQAGLVAPRQESGPRVGRRAILIGGAVAAGAAIGGGAYALARLRSVGSNGQAAQTRGPRKLIPGVPVLSLNGHTDEVWTATWNPAGRYLATAGKDGNIMLWDLAVALQGGATSPLSMPKRSWSVPEFAQAMTLNATSAGLCWTLDGQALIEGVNSFSTKIYAFDPTGPASTPTTLDGGTFADYNAVASGPLKHGFSAIDRDNVEVWNLNQPYAPQTSYTIGQPSGGIADIVRVSWSSDGTKMAGISGVTNKSNTYQLYLWQNPGSQTAQTVQLPQRQENPVLALVPTVAWSPLDDTYLLISDGDVALVWDVVHERAALTLGAPGNAPAPLIGALSWSPNGRYVAASYTPHAYESSTPLPNPQIFVWDIQTLLRQGVQDAIQQPALTFRSQQSLQHSLSITDLSWSPDGRYIATASLDKTVIIWKVDGG